MGRYFYPNAENSLEAKKQFLREHHYFIKHCFQNIGGPGYVLFDTKEEVNAWYKECRGEYFYKEEYEPGTVFTERDAIREIEEKYGVQIKNVLQSRDISLPFLAIGLPSATAFGNKMFLAFVQSTDEEDIAWRFYMYYNARIMHVDSTISNETIRERLIRMLYKYFYDTRFKKRIEGTLKHFGSK